MSTGPPRSRRGHPGLHICRTARFGKSHHTCSWRADPAGGSLSLCFSTCNGDKGAPATAAWAWLFNQLTLTGAAPRPGTHAQ